MANDMTINRRGILLAGAFGLSSVMLPSLGIAGELRARPRLHVLVTSTEFDPLLSELRSGDLQADALSAERLLLNPQVLRQYRGKRLLHIGSAADQVLVNLALADRAAGFRTRHSAFHRDQRTADGKSVHSIDISTSWSCGDGLKRDLAAAGWPCSLQGASNPPETDAFSLGTQRRSRWQVLTLAHLITVANAAETGPYDTLRWDNAPDEFSTLIVDL